MMEKQGEKNKWLLVEEKMEELRGLIGEKWQNEEWDLAILGERVLRTAMKAKLASDERKQQMKTIQSAVDSLRQKYEKLKQDFE